MLTTIKANYCLHAGWPDGLVGVIGCAVKEEFARDFSPDQQR